MGRTSRKLSSGLKALLKTWGAQVHSKGMAKPFFRPQKFLRRTQVLLFFLTAAYLMAGSLLLLQRSRLALQQGFRGTSGNQAQVAMDVSAGTGNTETRPVRIPPLTPKLLVDMDLLHGSTSDQRYGPRWLMSRNSELRQLRRRWFLQFVNEQEPVQSAGAKVIKQTTSEKKGKWLLIVFNTRGQELYTS